MKSLSAVFIVFVTLCQLSVFVDTVEEDPYRWIPTHGKPTTQTSTDGDHVASYATDGEYNKYHHPYNFSRTTVSDYPYLQVDMGKTVPVDYVTFHFPGNPPKIYEAIKVMLSDDAAFQADHVLCFDAKDASNSNWKSCNVWARYLTIQSLKTDVELSVVEISVHRRPIESIALRKPVTYSSVMSLNSVASKLVDMSFKSYFVTSKEIEPWVRVDLEELYYIFEVVIWQRQMCCEGTKDMIAVRVGRSLVNNGNSNTFCGDHTFYTYEIRSFYCKVIGRYVNVYRFENVANFFPLAEIVVNPETTDNVAIHSTNSANVAKHKSNPPRFLTDGLHRLCHIMVESPDVKKIWITMKEIHEIYKIFIVSNPKKKDTLVDFNIYVGMADQIKATCRTGLSMIGIHAKSFYCENGRLSGNQITIMQSSSEKTMSICEVAAFSEAKPEIDRNDWHVWALEDTEQLVLTCTANAYPVADIKWMKNNETLSNAETLELRSLKTSDSGEYECWASNTHGIDVKVVDLVVSGNLRVCADVKEIEFEIGQSEEEEFEFKGNQWYSFYDRHVGQTLKFSEISPKPSSRCHLFLHGKHPGLQDGVVSMKLCMRRSCSRTYDVFIRRCMGSYVYNFKALGKISSRLMFCLTKAKNLRNGVNPVISSPKYGYALLGSVFRTETEVEEMSKCMIMCQHSTNCQSFNFSKKEKICELSSATKKNFPKNYVPRQGYEYYQISKGIVVSRRGEL